MSSTLFEASPFTVVMGVPQPSCSIGAPRPIGGDVTTSDAEVRKTGDGVGPDRQDTTVDGRAGRSRFARQRPPRPDQARHQFVASARPSRS
ncbi:MAG: hypothetical protein CM15mP18_2360 [Methanobacteriota archaeon]|nr:MAG: hypothetical protein CM15mP18_2360 [Euryarchaeota archaeon]